MYISSQYVARNSHQVSVNVKTLSLFTCAQVLCLAWKKCCKSRGINGEVF